MNWRDGYGLDLLALALFAGAVVVMAYLAQGGM